MDEENGRATLLIKLSLAIILACLAARLEVIRVANEGASHYASIIR